MKRLPLAVLFFLIANSLACGTSKPPPSDIGQERHFDAIIRGGQLVDGSGGVPRSADVAIRDDAIAAIGDLADATAERIVDADGFVVAPGFIDMHSHSDYTLLVDGRGLSKTTQGVTTELLGESGSVAPMLGPVRAEAETSLANLGIELDWTTLAEYFACLERQGTSVNVMSTVGSGHVRAAVVGYDNRAPTDAELEQMAQLVEGAMRDGAVGLSSGLIYHPNSYSSTDELITLAKVAGRSGGLYVSHIRNENAQLLEALDEAIRVGREAGVQVEILHFKRASVRLDGGQETPTIRDAVTAIEQAQREGVRVYANVYPYAAGQSTLNMRIPDWAQEGGRQRLVERLRDPQTRERIKQDVAATLASGLAGRTPDTIMFGRTTHEPHHRFEGMYIGDIADELGVEPAEAYLQLIERAEGSTGGVFFGMREEDVEYALSLPWSTVGSDGSALAPEGVLAGGHPHPRSYGTFPRVLERYVRERGAISLPEAIRKMTSLPASRLGLTDRGLLAVGKQADIVVFDPDTITEHATFVEPHQLSTGVRWLFVNGQAVIADGRHTGARPGWVLRYTGRPSRGEATGASPAGSPPASAKARRLDEVLTGFHERGQFNGVVLLAEQDEVTFRKAFGVKDFATGEPLSTDTAFEVGSVSKPFTATAVLQLVERGMLSLNDSVTKHFANLPYEAVTLERMLSHTSGLFDVCCQPELRAPFDAFYNKAYPPYSNSDYLAFLEQQQPALLTDPGTEYRYSNTAYLLLALIVERVSGQRFDEFLKENVFDPIGLERTFVYSLMGDPTIPDRAVGYRRTENGRLVLDVPKPTSERPSVFGLTYGDDEVFSTVDDLFSFGQALKAGRLLKPETLEAALTPAMLGSGQPAGYGQGWRLSEQPDGRVIAQHGGSTNGFLATCTFSTTQNDTTVVMLSNVVSGDYADVRTAVFDIAWGEED
jgi:N-acyl-D-aspartate/D-glutamate deacylase/CubicO group peptidase (beta-lactamase class C family)